MLIQDAPIKTFPIVKCERWSYQTKTCKGICVVDGEEITMKFKLTVERPGVIPDVLGIETFCFEMGEQEGTLEFYTAKLLALVCELCGDGNGHYVRRVTGKGYTRTHGVITCTLVS